MANKSPEIEALIVQEPMVGWFEPSQLIRTGIRALLSALFGAYADGRELQAALDSAHDDDQSAKQDYSDHSELWFDFVADLGDGWHSTYSIAWLLSRPQLSVGNITLPRGSLLLMGGDQVYPTATRDAYQSKMIGPYTAALPWVDEAAGPPQDLYAIPGNHDWYDGLASFLKLFCQQRWIGGRRTIQRRSYFVLQLPHRWWLWAVDIQLEADIDDPQKSYFKAFANKLAPGDRVIFCPAIPSWVEEGDPRLKHDPTDLSATPNLTLLENYVRERGADVVLSLSGDSHHYTHYQQVDGPRHKFTAGGGGAFLRGTADLPPKLVLEEGGTDAIYQQTIAYPSASQSQALLRGNFAFFWLNRSYSTFIACVYVFYSWVWQSATTVYNVIDGNLMEKLSHVRLSHFWSSVPVLIFDAIKHRPGTLLMTMIIPLGTIAFANRPLGPLAGLRKNAWGLLHGLTHLSLCALLLWWTSRFNLNVVPRFLQIAEVDKGLWLDSAPQILLFLNEMAILGFVLGGSVTGLYLWFSNRLSGLHADEAFSALHIADYKNFLRLHLDQKGGMTIYSIGVDKACRRWKRNPLAKTLSSRGGFRPLWRFTINEKSSSPWLDPASGEIPIRLLETTRIEGQP